MFALVLYLATLGLVIAVDPLVDVGYTKYQGTSLSNGISQWLGIRYATPPTGNLRYRAPVDPPENCTTQIADEVSYRVSFAVVFPR